MIFGRERLQGRAVAIAATFYLDRPEILVTEERLALVELMPKAGVADSSWRQVLTNDQRGLD